MPACYGYTTSDPAKLEAYYRDRLASVCDFGGVFVDPEKFQALTARAEYYAVLKTLRDGDILLLNRLDELDRLKPCITALNNWLDLGVKIFVVGEGFQLTPHCPEGQAVINLVRSLARCTLHRKIRFQCRVLTDPRFLAFVGWGVALHRRKKITVLVMDRHQREAQGLILNLRAKGETYSQIALWLRSNRYLRNGKPWPKAGSSIKYAEGMEIKLQALEAQIQEEKNACAPSATPESVPKSKPATE